MNYAGFIKFPDRSASCLVLTFKKSSAPPDALVPLRLSPASKHTIKSKLLPTPAAAAPAAKLFINFISVFDVVPSNKLISIRPDAFTIKNVPKTL